MKSLTRAAPPDFAPAAMHRRTRRARARALLVAAALPTAAPFGFTVAPSSSECFNEVAKASDRVAGEWLVLAPEGAGAAAAVLDVLVTSPSGDHVYSAGGELQGSFAFYATAEGAYSVCFKNTDGVAPRDVSAKFTVGEPPDLIKLAKTEHLTPLEERIRSLHESMNAVRDLQDQMREQDERHHQMTRSTRARLVWFTLLEAFVLVAVSLWQILYLKSFFEVKRVV